jgi:hypothetical protein
MLAGLSSSRFVVYASPVNHCSALLPMTVIGSFSTKRLATAMASPGLHAGQQRYGQLLNLRGPVHAPFRELLQVVGLLAGDSGNEIEVHIDVGDGERRGFGCGGDQQFGDGRSAMLP